VRRRRLILELDSGLVLFLTPEYTFVMNSSFEGFVRCAVAFIEASDLLYCKDFRQEISDADPVALSDPRGIWENIVEHWEDNRESAT